MKHLVPLVVGSLVVSLVCAAALAQPAAPDNTVAPRSPADAGLSTEDRARRAKVLAKVHNQTITVGDVEDSIAQQSPFLRARYRDPAALRDFVQNMVRFELLARAADKKGYGRDEAVERSVSQNAVQQLMRREFDERITAESIPEADLQAYYDAHPDEFSREEMVRASHILVADRAQADGLLKQARSADARTFRQLAREHSVDTETKLRGGDLRYFNRSGRALSSEDPPVDPALVGAAFGLREVNDVVTQPVRVGESWSVVMLTGRRPAEHRALAEAGQSIRLRLWRERRQQTIDAFVADLRARLVTELHEDRMAAIQLEAAPEGAGHEGFPQGGKAGPGVKIGPTSKGIPGGKKVGPRAVVTPAPGPVPAGHQGHGAETHEAPGH